VKVQKTLISLNHKRFRKDIFVTWQYDNTRLKQSQMRILVKGFYGYHETTRFKYEIWTKLEK